MRVVFDTNALLRIFVRRGEMLKFRNLVIDHQITNITSPFILDEVERNLTARMHLTRQRSKAATKTLAKISQIVDPQAIPNVSRDTDDNNVLAAARKGKANLIITLDKDLLELEAYDGIQIITPSELQNLLNTTRK
jgi:uncharacterized protein